MNWKELRAYRSYARRQLRTGKTFLSIRDWMEVVRLPVLEGPESLKEVER